MLEREANSSTDNPLVFVDDNGDGEMISGGNFHGQPVAIALDAAAIAVAELANISERRVEQLVNPALSTGLSPFLAAGSGLHSGFMIAQVTSASLVSAQVTPAARAWPLTAAITGLPRRYSASCIS